MSTVVTTTPLPAPLMAKMKQSFRRVIQSSNFRLADGVFCLLTDRIDAKRLRSAPKLKAISIMAVGTNNVDIEEATRRGIIVTNTPGVLTETTADLTFALLMAAGRRLIAGDGDLRVGKFRGWEPFGWLGQDIHGATLGIIGQGRIGKAVAKRARGFGMKVLFADRNRASLERVLRQSDFISLHCPLTPQTHHLIGTRELRMMKRTATLINTARGPVVDETALVQALRKKTIASAGLDVYEHEPQVTRALLRMKNVVLLPHIGSASHATRTRMAEMAIENLTAALSGRRPRHAVNPKVLPRLRG